MKCDKSEYCPLNDICDMSKCYIEGTFLEARIDLAIAIEELKKVIYAYIKDIIWKIKRIKS